MVMVNIILMFYESTGIIVSIAAMSASATKWGKEQDGKSCKIQADVDVDHGKGREGPYLARGV